MEIIQEKLRNVKKDLILMFYFHKLSEKRKNLK